MPHAMTAGNLIHASKAAIDVLNLACKHADNRWEWWQINRLAAELVSGLRIIEQDDAIIHGLRKEAHDDAFSLALIMKESCQKVEEYDQQPPVISGI